jgi:hypothetical protein
VSLAGLGRGRRSGGAACRRRPPVRRAAVEHLEDETEAVEIQEVIRPGRGINLRRREIIRAAQGDGGMPSVGESDDEIGLDSPTETNDLDTLSTERVMGMGDGDESRRRLGRGGSALGASPQFVTGLFKRRC